jgi:D-alanyl-D-alanine carboxypeptidase
MLSIRRVLACCLLASSIAAADRLDDIVRTEMDRQHIPGVALGVVRDNEPVRMSVYGMADLENNVPVTPQTVFKIGSISKQFIAAGVLLLADEGKLSLEDRVGRYLEDAPPSWSGVTIRRLLSHTSGITREAPAFRPFREVPDIEAVRSAYTSPLEFAPGEKWQYSNVSYFAAAEIIRRLSGMPWEEFIAARLFRPLGMKTCRATSLAALVPHRAHGYDWHDGEYRNSANFLAVRPSGAFLSSLEDLVRWDIALSTGAAMKKKLTTLMWQPVMLNNGTSSGYGLGWRVGDRNGKQVVHHGGTLGGFKSYYARFVRERTSVIVLTNLSSAKPEDIAWPVASAVLSSAEHSTTAATR